MQHTVIWARASSFSKADNKSRRSLVQVSSQLTPKRGRSIRTTPTNFTPLHIQVSCRSSTCLDQSQANSILSSLRIVLLFDDSFHTRLRLLSIGGTLTVITQATSSRGAVSAVNFHSGRSACASILSHIICFIQRALRYCFNS